MDNAEVEFRHIERRLDDLVREAKAHFRSADVLIEDRSARGYHYKNDHLFWSICFVKEWRVDIERARVTVELEYGEPLAEGDTPVIELKWRAELFQEGQDSRIDRRGQSNCSLAGLERQGIFGLVEGSIREATACLPHTEH